MTLILLFLAGAVQDALQALFIKLAVGKNYLLAAVVSMLITLIAYGVFMGLMESLLHGNPSNLLAYAFGGGCGTWVTLRYKQT